MTVIINQNILSELGKEHTIPLLEVLFMQGWMISSEVARELGIHISTAQIYLETLKKNNILTSRNRVGRKGPVEYSLKDPFIQVNINLNEIIAEKEKEAKEKARLYFINERAGHNVSYEWNEEKRKILVINFLKKSKKYGRLKVSHTIRLNDIEGKFLWYLPQATEKPRNVFTIATQANLNNNVDFIKIIELIEMLAEERVIKIYDKGETL